MCGICGVAFTNPEARADQNLVVTMRDAIAHRGPDGAGILDLPGATLAHRRLSIIDLAHGEQPMSNEDKSVWVTFNGEIYNFHELEAELSARGHRFRTRCDTEVLVHAYEEYGDAFVERLNGMFAFALYDLAQHRLLLARDHLGIKPMFYARINGGLAFGSEIKAVLPALDRSPSVRYESLQEYLVFRYVAWDRTFYEDVHRLPPGHVATWERGRLTVRRYWSPTHATLSATTRDIASSAQQLETHLERAVRSQLMSDVPLGAFCSGGIDSGLVTTYAARGSTSFHSFSVGFDDPTWDETPLARETAARAGANHHVIVSRPESLEQMLQQLIHYHDEPLSHPNSVPLYELSGLARQHVKVVLTGEGADELFAGYPRYHLARARGAFEMVPSALRSAGASILRGLPGHRAAKAASQLPLSIQDCILLNSAYVQPDVVAALTSSDVSAALDRRRELVAETFDARDTVGSISRYELLTYLPCALDRMDRMSMAHSLEGRVPFLDVPLVEFSLSLPSPLKLGLRSNKRILKRVASNVLSARIVHGPKSGFGLPLDAWFRGPELGDVMRRMTDPSHPAASSFDQKILNTIVREHRSRSHNHGEVLWLLANVYLWFDQQSERTRTIGALSLSRRTSAA